MQNSIKKNMKGITLIALVVTIVILLILAGVSLNLVLGNNGIVNKAKDAKEVTARARAEESVALEVAGSYGIDGKIDMPLLNENLKHIKDLTYNGEALSDTNQIESLPTTVVVDGYDVVIDEEAGTSILGDIPEHPELSGFDWFVVGETEPDEESKDIAEYLIKSGHGKGTLIIYPRNGKSATITASDLEAKTLYDEEFYLPQWCSQINEELALKITSVYVAPQVSTEHATYFFKGLENCEKIDITNLETSKVTDMQYMFDYNPKLAEIKGIEKLNTSNVTNMEEMLGWCDVLKSIDTTGWDTSKVRNMDNMFAESYSLETIEGISDWDVSNVTSMWAMFQDCSSLDNINLGKWNVSKVEDMSSMFSFSGMETLDWISNWDVSNVKDFGFMLKGNNIKTLDLSKWDTSSATSMDNMFARCNKLTTINMSNWDTSNVTNMREMFSGCSALASIDLSSFNTTNVSFQYGMYSMFKGCSSLTSLDLSTFNTTNVKYMSEMFKDCTQLTTIWSGPDWSTSHITNANNKKDMFTGCGTDHVTPK